MIEKLIKALESDGIYVDRFDGNMIAALVEHIKKGLVL